MGKRKNRIKELRQVKASDLLASGKNWRIHSQEQRAAMDSLLDGVGYAGAVIAYEGPDGRLILIDGHMRAELAGEDAVPVLVLDVDEAEANLILASYDKAGAMATADYDALSLLLADCAPVEGLDLLFVDVAAAMERGENLDPEAEPEPDPVYPLAPNLDEGYDCAIIFCRRATEFAQLATLLELPQREYKSGRVGMCRVISFEEFETAWKRR